MQRPAITYIVPTYNSSCFIKETLLSAKSASGNLAYEIILIDDCSSDIDQLRTIAANTPHCVLIEKKIKTNAADSRRLGVEASNGIYVQFLDSDDRLVPNSQPGKLATLIKTGADFIVTAFVEGDNIIRSELEENLALTGDGRIYLFEKGLDVRSSVVLIDKSSFQNKTFNPALTKHQDWGFFIEALDRGLKFCYSKEVATIIDDRRVGRMSSRVNKEGSKLFISLAKLSKNQSSNLAKRHIKICLYCNDFQAFKYYASLLTKTPNSLKNTIIRTIATAPFGKYIFKPLSYLLRAVKI
ncbi:glycosyltransferase family 2 protein [Pseudomonas sp. PDM19]|uniref:glycosyltransferase family 2 protein n=1 Tax=Pseudomonas sp. PDM19 TaxID=2769272 RepID=UPI001CE1FFE5|nr:glycosyltransferase family 2 protein [Pseudomonas sp. PDM19]